MKKVRTSDEIQSEINRLEWELKELREELYASNAINNPSYDEYKNKWVFYDAYENGWSYIYVLGVVPDDYLCFYSDMSIYNTVQNIMEKYNKKAIFDDLDKYDYLAKESDFIEVTEWHNGEGWDIYINDTHISLTSGQLDAINYLTKSLDLSK